MEYFIHAECPKCDGDVYDRGLNLAEHNGLPVFSLDQFSQYSMTCRNEVYKSYGAKDSEDKILTKEEYDALPEEQKGNYTPDTCDYNFGTGDIEIMGEDEW